MNSSLKFTAIGIPQPQGSSSAFIPKGWKRAIVTSANPKLKGWRLTVGAAALAALRSAHASKPLFPKGQPVAIDLQFYLPRPKRQKGDRPHVSTPDSDKLARGICDALTGILYADDAQVNEITLRKAYAPTDGQPSVEIFVTKGRV